eukprot:m.112793 g.112793  ORF g.112793 m.112793 type:complete len:435 (+) comp28219_c0_seq2:214-1518(+)
MEANKQIGVIVVLVVICFGEFTFSPISQMAGVKHKLVLPPRKSIQARVPDRQKNTLTTANWSTMDWQPLHAQIVCCGWGDRLHFLENQVEGFWEHRKSAALDWGPCGDNISNIISALFALPRLNYKTVPNILPNSQTIYAFERNASDVNEPHFATFGNDQASGKIEGVSMVSKRARFKPGPDNYAILSDPMAKVYQTLFNSIKPEWHRYVDDLMDKETWRESKIISIHVRTGNMQDQQWRDRAFKRKLTNVEAMLQTYLELGEEIAKKLEWSSDFKFFVASDDMNTSATMRKLTNRKVISREFLLPIEPNVGHPMVWANLHDNNAGPNCRLEWFIDPLLDMKLLSEADVFISTTDTGFVTAAQSVVYHKDNVLCFNDGAHTLTCKRRKTDPLNVQKPWGNRTISNFKGNSQWIDGDFIKTFKIPDWFSVSQSEI